MDDTISLPQWKGYRDCKDGIHYSDNPYETEEDRLAWSIGWLDAMQDMTFAENVYYITEKQT